MYFNGSTAFTKRWRYIGKQGGVIIITVTTSSLNTSDSSASIWPKRKIETVRLTSNAKRYKIGNCKFCRGIKCMAN